MNSPEGPTAFQLDSSAASPLALDRHSEVAQGDQVALDRSQANPQIGREVASGRYVAVSQQHPERIEPQYPASGRGITDHAEKYDIDCRITQ